MCVCVCTHIYIYIYIQGLDKKYWQLLYSSEMTLLPEVNTFTFLQYNLPPCAPPSAKFVEGVVHHQRVHFC